MNELVIQSCSWSITVNSDESTGWGWLGIVYSGVFDER